MNDLLPRIYLMTVILTNVINEKHIYKGPFFTYGILHRKSITD